MTGHVTDLMDHAEGQATDEILQTAQLLHRGGRLEEANQLYRKVLATDPEHPAPYHLLGLIALQIGQPDVAQDLIAAATELAPKEAVFRCDLGTAYFALEDLDAAAANFREAIRLDPEYVEARINLGKTLKNQGLETAAAEALEEAVSLGSRSAEVFSLLGELALRRRDFDAAESFSRAACNLEPGSVRARETLTEALVLGSNPREGVVQANRLVEDAPATARYHQMLAEAHIAAGEQHLALEPARQACSLAPTCSDSKGILAHVLTAIGNWDASLEVIDEALALSPNETRLITLKAGVLERKGQYAEAFGLIQPLIAGRREFSPGALETFGRLSRQLGIQDKAIDVYEQVLESARLPTYLHANFLFSLGHLYDDRHRYDDAFRVYAVANERKPRNYDHAQTEGFFADSESVFTTERIRTMASRGRVAAADGIQPIFIVGMPRSGTSLTEKILASHPQVSAAGELNDITQLARQLELDSDDLTYPRVAGDLSGEQLDDLRQRYLERLSSMAGDDGTVFVTDKMPMNFRFLGLISALFPNAPIVHCKRDPLDTCLSGFVQNFQTDGLGYTFSLDSLAHYYRLYRHNMEHWRRVLPTPFFELDYEVLVKDPEPTIRRLLAYCGLEWDNACLRHHETKGDTTTASYSQVRKPIYTSSVGKWRNYSRHLKPLKEQLKDFLD